jgi:hypothetical protein
MQRDAHGPVLARAVVEKAKDEDLVALRGREDVLIELSGGRGYALERRPLAW